MDWVLERQPFNGYFMIMSATPFPCSFCGCHMQFKFPCRHHVFVYYHNTDVNLNATLQSTLVEPRMVSRNWSAPDWIRLIAQHNATVQLFGQRWDGEWVAFTMDSYLNSNRLTLLLCLIASILRLTFPPKEQQQQEQHRIPVENDYYPWGHSLVESSLLCGNNGSNAPAEERYKTTKLCDLFVLRRPNEEITIRTTRFKNRSKRALVARSGIYSSVSLAILLGTLLSLPFSRAFACFWMAEMVRWSFRFDWMRIYYFSSILIIIPRENRWNVSSSGFPIAGHVTF